MNLSFKAPQPSPMGMLLSFARAIGIVSADDDVVIVPLARWRGFDLCLVRFVALKHRVEAAETALFHITALIWSERDPRMKRGDLITASELADHLDDLHDDLRSALARVVELEIQNARLTSDYAQEKP